MFLLNKFIIIFIIFATYFCMSYTQELDCSFKYDSSIEEKKFYNCEIQNQGIFGDFRVYVTKINGKHVTGHENGDVQAIQITSNNLNYIPRNVEEFLPNIVTMMLYKTNIKTISQADFRPFLKLEYLYLHENRIREVLEDFFKYNSKLKLLSLDKNEISYIDPFAFQNLKSLEFLNLKGNRCPLQNAYGHENVLKLIEKIENFECIDRKVKLNLNLSQLEIRKLNDKIENLIIFIIVLSVNVFLIFIFLVIIVIRNKSTTNTEMSEQIQMTTTAFNENVELEHVL
ncbi:hypothetical protein PVAND_006375 [Polypedilum vanderplanki]|uniref:Leucine rich repeat protein n=1 Tax=Polypedilum vanderplanki TaxID=319348 RepID=A0A9J6C4Q9_POLVA|nr:hypothetical protein PVAND_006375 [Polypedilum vanderplanki]